MTTTTAASVRPQSILLVEPNPACRLQSTSKAACSGFAAILVPLLVLVAFICCMLCVVTGYRKDGDIRCAYDREIMQCREDEDLYACTARRYPTPASVVERLHQLTLYKGHYVRWPFNLVIALGASLLLLYVVGCMTGACSCLLTPCNILVSVIVLFLAIDVPTRWGETHVASAQDMEAAFLHAWYSHMTRT